VGDDNTDKQGVTIWMRRDGAGDTTHRPGGGGGGGWKGGDRTEKIRKIQRGKIEQKGSLRVKLGS
jgi:hypothetical protein